jgi:hypothetical protein
MYNRYISFGMNYEVAFQLRRFFGKDDGSYFNWLFTPLPSLVAILDNNFKDTFLKENLEPNPNYTMVKDTLYGNSYHSPFYKKIGTAFSGEEFDALYEEEYSKVMYLKEKFRNIARSSEKVLYMMVVHMAEPKEHVLKLRDILKRDYPTHDFDILVIREQKNQEPDWNEPHIIQRYTEYFAPIAAADKPDIAAWDRFFAEFPLTRELAA